MATLCSVNKKSEKAMQHLPKHQHESPLRNLCGTENLRNEGRFAKHSTFVSSSCH